MTSEPLKIRPVRTNNQHHHYQNTQHSTSQKPPSPITNEQHQRKQNQIEMDNNQRELNSAMLLNGRASASNQFKQKFATKSRPRRDDEHDNNIADLDQDQTNSSNANDKMKLRDQQPHTDSNSALDSIEPSDDPSRHHVGPVMGIFFKVWSLVKVTRGRHAQKMRRQNSEDAGQFHFVSGEQLASTSGLNQSRHAALAHKLQDSHFRRAGSQPAPSTSHSLATLDHLIPRQQQLNNQQLHWLQVNQGQQQQPNSQMVVAPAGTASGSSSGVSSITSSTLGAGGAEQTTGGGRAGNSASCPTATTTKTKKNSNDSPGVLETKRKLGAGPKSSQQQQQQQHAKGTWASRIKRSATTLNQSTSVTARSHFKQQNNRTNQVPERTTTTQATGEPAVRQARAKSEQTNQPDELHKRWMRAHLIARETISDDDDNEANYDVDGDRSSATNKRSFLVGDEDSDFNDIYSTPNDSIQSVPSTAPIAQGNQSICNPKSSFGQQNAFMFPIKKSFSANSFSQLINRQQQPVGENNNCGPIEEQQESGSTSNNNSQPPATNLSSSQDNHKFQTNCNHHDGDTSQTNNNNDSENRLQTGRRLVAGSRFFISSSSSEESNPPGSQQQQQQTTSKQSKATLISDNEQQQHRAQLPVHFGLHYHEPVATRPDSLILGNNTNNTVHFIGPPLSTPIPTAALAGTPLVAAMSPASAIPPGAHFWVPAMQPPVCGYKKSPSLFEMSSNNNSNGATRFSSRFPLHNTQLIDSNQTRLKLIDQKLNQKQAYFLSSFKPAATNQRALLSSTDSNKKQVPNSVSLQDCKLTTATNSSNLFPKSSGVAQSRQQHSDEDQENNNSIAEEASTMSEYKLTQMLLESGSNPAAKDQSGCTALMHAVLSENLPALKCLIEHRVDLNVTNNQGLSALDLVCSRGPSEIRIEMLKLLIDNQADLDSTRDSDGTRLLDRLIAEHDDSYADKLPFIDCLLHNGAKLGSSTWFAANGKHEIQLRLLKKLCQDGYFLYKKCSIEPAVYRFEYALKRIAELEKQLDCVNQCRQHSLTQLNHISDTMKAAQQIKYQTYLGLSRCERKRKFFKRALEFAHMSILVNSTSYEGYYSKANILKDLGEFNEALSAINQTNRLVDNLAEVIKSQLTDLQHQEESIVFDGCFDMHDPGRSCLIEASRNELIDNLDYLEEAKKHISRLRGEILEDKASALVET